MSLSAAPDALLEGKFPFAQNIRGYLDDQVTSRPEWQQLTAAPGVGPGACLALDPALGIYKIGAAVYLNAVQLAAGYAANVGVSLVPFRPNASPQAWEYVFDAGKQTKILPNPVAPAASILKKVGIVEPQLPCDAQAPVNLQQNIFNVGGGAGSFAASGTAVAPANGNRVTDVVVANFPDPLGSPFSVQVSANVQYQKNMCVVDATISELAVVLDVFPGALQAVALVAVYYFAGTTGHCILVPRNVNAGPGDPGVGISQQQLLGTLRRGSLLALKTAGGAAIETVYVWSVTEGPDGSVCVETSTVGTIVAGNTLTAVPAIQISVGGFTAGHNITSPDVVSSVPGAGIGSLVAALATPFFTQANFSFRDQDFVHLSIQVGDPNAVASCRVGFDVSDGTFTKDYYYYEVRASDIQGALTGVAATQLTQIAAAQLLEQRGKVDASQATAYNNEVFSSSGSQLLPANAGSYVWHEVVFPISALTRVGNDQTKTIANAGWFSFAIDTSGAMGFQINSLTVFGGNDLDVGVLLPYQYRYRARDSQTGAASNWSPVLRYGVNPRRSQVLVLLPGAYPDAQADTFDLERMGGALEDWTFVGSVPIGQNFTDLYGDAAVAGNATLPEDNYEPFPSVGPPLQTNATSSLTGYVATLKFPAASANPAFLKFANLLPGNLLQVGQQVYTTYARPVFVSTAAGVTTYTVQIQENAGVLANVAVTVSEPLLANQTLAQVWGPDDNGCLFAVGDQLRPGGVYNTNPQNPDGCNEGVNFNELCAPTEPLINGALIQQTSCAASAIRWWAGRSGQDAAGNLKYNWIEIPVGRGLAATYGVCSDGDHVYFVGKDGIYMHSGGPAESLTDEDLYPLFPHEGLLPGTAVANISYNGNTAYAPNYQQSQAFRLAVVNRFLYFDYPDSNNVYRTLVCNLRTRAWGVDTYALVANRQLTLHAGIPAGWSAFAGNYVDQLYAADTQGLIAVTNSNPAPNTETVPCVLCTREETGDDVRAPKLFGDAAIDKSSTSAITVTPITLGTAQAATVVGASGARQPGVPIDLAGELLAQSLGLQFAWSDLGGYSILYSWQVSWTPEPERTALRFTNWEGGEDHRNLFFQGFELEADTGNAAKGLKVRDADGLALHPFSGPAGAVDSVQHNGHQTLPYSFVTPFRAHLVRLEPQDGTLWRLFRVRWVARPTPDAALNWVTQPTAYGLPGYHHVHHALFAYASTQAVTLTVTTDGAALAYVLPATGGAYKKALVMFQPVKGLVDAWSAVSAAAFQVWTEDCEIFCKAWGDPAPYRNARLLGREMTPDADI